MNTMENFDALTNETQDYADHLKYLKSKKYVTIEDFISHFGLTKAVGLKILDRLQTADKIASFEGKNGTYYISKRGQSLIKIIFFQKNMWKMLLKKLKI